jgi:molybdate transport system permease protein
VRAELRRELRRLQREVNLSTVLVTHDPEEAAMLADQIMVVSDGQVLQSGSCRDVFQRPASAVIGRLLGIDNLFEGVAGAGGVLLPGGDRAPDVPGGGVPGDSVPVSLATGLPVGARLLWQVPPEALRVGPGPSPSRANGSPVDLGQGEVTDIIDLGRSAEVVVLLSSGIELRARALELPDLSVGAACRVETDRDAVSVWPTPAVTGTSGDTALHQPVSNTPPRN